MSSGSFSRTISASPLQLVGSRLSLSQGWSSGSPSNTKLSLPGPCRPDKSWKQIPGKQWIASAQPGSTWRRRLAGGPGELMVPHQDVNLALGQGLMWTVRPVTVGTGYLSDQPQQRPSRADVTLIKRPRSCRLTASSSQALMASPATVPRTSHNAGLSLLHRRQTASKTRRVCRTQQAWGSDSCLHSPVGFTMTEDFCCTVNALLPAYCSKRPLIDAFFLRLCLGVRIWLALPHVFVLAVLAACLCPVKWNKGTQTMFPSRSAVTEP